MDRNETLLRALGTALTAALMAGCAAMLIVRTMGFSIAWPAVYLTAGCAAALVQAARRGTIWAVGASAALLIALGALTAVFLPEIRAAVRDMGEMEAAELVAAHARAGVGVGAIAALALGALMAGLVQSPASAPFALVVTLAATICALAVNEDISLWAAAPGLIAGVAAFALPAPARKSGVRPLLLIPGALLVVAAMLLTPAARTTWAPLADLAERIRAVVEDYVRFTEERVAFSINEKGYDRAGMVGEDVVAMLGGPANPSTDEVMRVETDVNLLLRGTIKRSYTGYSWIDDQPKARYLYYDFTHRGVRADAFDSDTARDSAGFAMRSASVEMLENGTSTLFVPAQLAEFDMGLADAVYYNSAGELFLTRDVTPGDRYAFSARLPQGEEALVAAAAQRMNASDDRLAVARENYMQLPTGIDERVYALAMELTQHTNNPAEKAFAIQNYLAQNYRYTLDGGYPEPGRDFVSWFLTEAGEGYCSYFASAMAVMCRISGVPARYVEGYFVHAQPGGVTTVTGRNAHAWVEVYLNGLGWVAFDPTARSVEAQGDLAEGALMQGAQPQEDSDELGGREAEAGGGESESDGGEHSGENGADGGDTGDGSEGGGDLSDGDLGDGGSDGDSDADEPTPPPEEPEDSPEPTASPTPDPADPPQTPTPNPESPPEAQTPPPELPPQPDTPPDAQDEDADLTWLWILLGALALAALIALALLWARRRMAKADPLRLAAAANPNQGALILYRAMLTLLSLLGQAPMNGETPTAFAERVEAAIPNEDYAAFVAGVARSRYSGRGVSRETIEAGRRAYLGFLGGMRRGERLRFALRRMLHGLGSFDNIP